MRRRRQSLPRQPAWCAKAPRTATMTWRRLIRPSASPGPARKASRCVSGTITLNQHANPAGTASSIPEPPIAAPRHPRAPSRDPPRAPSPGCGCSSCPPTPLVSTRWKGSGRCSSAMCWPTRRRQLRPPGPRHPARPKKIQSQPGLIEGCLARTGLSLDVRTQWTSRIIDLYFGRSCAVPPALKSRELSCPCMALAADLDGTFAVARMQPVFRGAVQIGAVVAARPRGGFPCWPPRVCGGVGGP